VPFSGVTPISESIRRARNYRRYKSPPGNQRQERSNKLVFILVYIVAQTGALRPPLLRDDLNRQTRRAIHATPPGNLPAGERLCDRELNLKHTAPTAVTLCTAIGTPESVTATRFGALTIPGSTLVTCTLTTGRA